MNTLKKIFGTFLLISILYSCGEWLDINQNPDTPTEEVVSESVLLPGIISTISYELAGGFPARHANAWVGQFSLNGPAPDVQTFKILDTDVNNTWEYTLYTNVLKNSKLLITKAENNGNKYYSGIGKVMTAYSLAIATDLWGSIPWSEALNPEEFPKPKFDTQDKVYEAIFILLDEAIANFEYTGQQTTKPGSDDLLFRGNIPAWKKFAYSLKARYNMRLSYAKAGATQADLVLAALEKGFTSNSDDADFAYFDKTGAENPWYQWYSKFNTLYLDTNTYIILKKYNDPRLDVFADTTYADGVSGEIIPHRNGLLTEIPGVTSKLAIERTTYDDGEDKQPYFITKSTPVPFITYAENCFLKAEAYLWKNDFAKAAQFMKEGTKASLLKLQSNNEPAFSESAINNYVDALPSLPSNFEGAQKMIIELKFIGNFLSVENYNDYRRTHYPTIVLPMDAEYTHVPYRMPYATSPKLYNKDNVPSVEIDKDKVWWDKK
ncbi:MAG TPA: hypothetical protein DHV48_12020 [Prolixibacteraceae bacterium]|nr:hypothetical protein [Prolixibacteraceae bacterium]